LVSQSGSDVQWRRFWFPIVGLEVYCGVFIGPLAVLMVPDRGWKGPTLLDMLVRRRCQLWFSIWDWKGENIAFVQYLGLFLVPAWGWKYPKGWPRLHALMKLLWYPWRDWKDTLGETLATPERSVFCFPDRGWKSEASRRARQAEEKVGSGFPRGL